MQNRIISLFLVFVLTGCGHRVMTMQSFAEIPVGTSEKQLKVMAGAPYEVHERENGVVEYEYIEKLTSGLRVLEERRYFIILKDNQVIGKRVQQSSLPPYRLNSYDLQTTYGDEVSPPDDTPETFPSDP